MHQENLASQVSASQQRWESWDQNSERLCLRSCCCQEGPVSSGARARKCKRKRARPCTAVIWPLQVLRCKRMCWASAAYRGYIRCRMLHEHVTRTISMDITDSTDKIRRRLDRATFLFLNFGSTRRSERHRKIRFVDQ